MSRTNIDYGIDLGTTNSAIARSENGVVRIIKSDKYQKDTMASCVCINKKGSIIVGDDAFNELNKARVKKRQNPEASTSDVYAEFKRMMGTDQTHQSLHLDRSLTPEDLSSEVLKKLKSFVKDDDAIPAIVITVPAKFENPQIDATQKAAELAGFAYCELLQEPIAASIAYGLSGKDIEGNWVVFDFGGGTFDAALMKVEDGIIKVVDTEGDNRLGGKNLDDAIVDKILVPWLEAKCSIESRLGDKDLKALLRNALKRTAEETKIALSNEGTTSHEIFFEDFMEDDEGEEVDLDLTVAAEQYEQAVTPCFQKAIDITKELLRRNNLKSAELERIVLVGGPTLSHLFRQMLREQFEGTEVDVSIDPMTAVAEGAAIFASTKKIPEGVRPKDLAKAQLKLEHADTTVEAEEHVAIRVLRDETEGDLPETLSVELANKDESWSSGRSELEGDADVLMVNLNEDKSNVFRIDLFDADGNRVPCEPETFTILQGINIANAPLAFSMGLSVHGAERGDAVYEPLEGLERNQPLPATARIKLRTLQDKNPAKGDTLTFDLRQGSAGDDKRVRSRSLSLAGLAEISSDDLPGFLPAGSELELTIRVDESSRYSGEIYFINLDEIHDFKFPERRQKIPDSEELTQQIDHAKSQVTMGEDLPSHESDAMLDQLKKLQNELDDAGTDEDTRTQSKEELRKIWKKIDKMEDTAAWPRLEAELEEALEHLRELEVRFGDGDQKLSAEFEGKIDQVKSKKDNKMAESLRDEIRGAGFSFLREQPGWWISMIESVQREFDTIQWKNETEARMVLDEARRAIRTNPSVENLGAKYWALRELMQDPTVAEGTSGADFELAR